MLRYSREPAPPLPDAAPVYPYFWRWLARLPERKGQFCRVLAWGRMNTVLIEFPDGYRVTTSRHGIRLRRPPEKIC